MNISCSVNRYTWLVLMICISTADTGFAAPGTLSNTPLFLTNRAEPNIFFMLDDSNSMNTDPRASDHDRAGRAAAREEPARARARGGARERRSRARRVAGRSLGRAHRTTPRAG